MSSRRTRRDAGAQCPPRRADASNSPCLALDGSKHAYFSFAKRDSKRPCDRIRWRLATATPVVAAEPASSVSFVNRDALTATSTNGWRNPLRAGSSDSGEEAAGNSLRENVTPVSYEEEVGANSRTPSGLQLRPHTKPNGIFSGMMGQGKVGQAQLEADEAATPPRRPSSRNFARHKLGRKRRTSAAQKALGHDAAIPIEFGSKASASGRQVASGSSPRRFGPARGRPKRRRSDRRRRRAAPASYNSAASAQDVSASTAQAAGRRPLVGRSLANPAVQLRAATKHGAVVSPNDCGSHASAIRVRRDPATGDGLRPADDDADDRDGRRSIVAGGHSDAGSRARRRLLARRKTSRRSLPSVSRCRRGRRLPRKRRSAGNWRPGRSIVAVSCGRGLATSEAAMADFESAIRIDAKCWRALHNRGVLLGPVGPIRAGV